MHGESPGGSAGQCTGDDSLGKARILALTCHQGPRGGEGTAARGGTGRQCSGLPPGPVGPFGDPGGPPEIGPPTEARTKGEHLSAKRAGWSTRPPYRSRRIPITAKDELPAPEKFPRDADFHHRQDAGPPPVLLTERNQPGTAGSARSVRVSMRKTPSLLALVLQRSSHRQNRFRRSPEGHFMGSGAGRQRPGCPPMNTSRQGRGPPGPAGGGGAVPHGGSSFSGLTPGCTSRTPSLRSLRPVQLICAGHIHGVPPDRDRRDPVSWLCPPLPLPGSGRSGTSGYRTPREVPNESITGEVSHFSHCRSVRTCSDLRSSRSD